jgi:hypothetical protein
MNDLLDKQLRVWGARARASAPEVGVPVERLADRRRKPLGAAIAAAAAVAAIAVGISVVQHGGPDSGRGPAGGTASAPPGYRAVTFHGLTIDVPSAWPLTAMTCGQPTQDTVILPVATVALCGFGSDEKLTTVTFSEGSDPGGPELDAQMTSTTATTITGTRAKKMLGTTRQGSVVIQFGVPAVDASVTIASPARSNAEQLAASLRIVQRDSNGCLAKDSEVSVIPTGRAPARAGAATSIVPGDPIRMTICRYEATLIEQSSSLDRAQQARLRSVLDALPPGLDDMGGSGPQCRRSATDPGSTTGPDAGDSEAYRIQADYGAGPPVVVIVRLGQCRDIGASNGTATGKPTSELPDELQSLVGMTQMPG